ncbi:alpha-D-ribose 1-methylphosphonate 5-triphosphate diphosphatase [Microbacterium sp. gxy059]|uniref:alpha-D-ribose 1-methylphosphonate 5-triphosphate diphosphatase n=1 Tax=Microbacterium sp. gxy059 TaxID=2957199 RepID=UPI003D998EAC
MTTTTLANARVVLPDEVVHASVEIDGDRIIGLGAPDASGEDMAGDYLLPGLVELHTDQVESHYQPRPRRFWDPLTAVISHDAQMAASGITTVFDALRIGSGPGDRTVSQSAGTLIEAIVHAAEEGLLRADHLVHLRCEVATDDVIEAFEEVGGHDRVRLVSLMDHTPGQRQYADVSAFRTYMRGKHRFTDEEFEAHVAELHVRAEKYSDVNRREMARRARERGITMAAHDDATALHVAESTDLGVRISEFPTTETAARAARAAGQLIVMGAPNIVRGGSHSGNVAAQDLLVEGLLDILSSDYVPASPLQAAFSLFGRDLVTLPQAAALVSGNPARAIGLDDRGEIAAGRRADLVRVRAHRPIVGNLPEGALVPIVRGVWREGSRVA